MSHRVLIVDDEALARARLVRLLAASEGFAVAGEARHGGEALSWLGRHRAEIVLADIRMPVMGGLQLARSLAAAPAPPPAVILCTAYQEHALDAFDAGVCAYLLKPVRAEKLHAALRRAALLAPPLMPASAEQAAGFLRARSSTGVALIPLSDIIALVANQKSVAAIHGGGEHLVDASLCELESAHPDQLLRVHRNGLVSRHAIRALERGADGQVLLRLAGTGRRLRVSRRHLPAVRALLAGATA